MNSLARLAPSLAVALSVSLLSSSVLAQTPSSPGPQVIHIQVDPSKAVWEDRPMTPDEKHSLRVMSGMLMGAGGFIAGLGGWVIATVGAVAFAPAAMIVFGVGLVGVGIWGLYQAAKGITQEKVIHINLGTIDPGNNADRGAQTATSAAGPRGAPAGSVGQTR